jgi:hypothetical protein
LAHSGAVLLSSRVEPTDKLEQELAAGLGEGQIAELVEDGEVLAGQVIGNPALPTVAALGLEPIDQIDDIEEAAAGAAADARASDRDGEMGLATSGVASQHDIALLRDEAAGGESRGMPPLFDAQPIRRLDVP